MRSSTSKSERKTNSGFAHSKKPLGILRWVIFGGLLVLLAAGGYVIYVRAIPNETASVSTSTLQTAVARQGNLIIEASGAGTLISANEVNIGFPSSGTLKELYVQVGDQVTEGQVLATLDTTSLETALIQAKQTLLEMTSPGAIATAESNLVKAQEEMLSARSSLAGYISEGVLYYQEGIVTAQQKLYEANLAELNSPTTANQQAVFDANDALTIVKTNLISAKNTYETVYLPKYFTTRCTDDTTHRPYSCIIPPTDFVVQQAQTTYNLAKAKYQQAQYLVAALKGDTVPENATGSDLVALTKAKEAVQNAQTDLDNAILTAPFDGTIMNVNATIGSAVNDTILTIADLSTSNLIIYMDETDWQNVKVGYTAQATFDALPNEVFTGKVIQVYPSLTNIGGSTMIEGLVELDKTPTLGSDRLPLGVSASVDIIAAQAENVVLVPVEALHKLSSGNYAVFVMESEKPVLRMVTVGLQDDTFAEITSGLQVGEIITTGIVETKQ